MHGYIAGNKDISLRCSRFPQRNFFEKKKDTTTSSKTRGVQKRKKRD